MEEHGAPLLVASILALGTGPLLYHLAHRFRAATWALSAAIVVAVVALIVLHVLPECVEMAGPISLFAAAFGLALPIVVERFAGKIARSDLGAARHAAHRIGIVLALFAFVAHEMMDGMALVDMDAAHGHSHGAEGEHMLGLAVVLHRIPVGAALFFFLGGGKKALAWAALGVSACATLGGFFVAETVLPLLDGTAVGCAQAFFGGVLLHVLAHRFEAPRVHAEHGA